MYVQITYAASGVTIVVAWRPSCLLSVRLALALTQLQRNSPDTNMQVVTVLCPKYKNEFRSLEGATNTVSGLLLSGEEPDNILLDSELKYFKSIECKNWPTVIQIQLSFLISFTKFAIVLDLFIKTIIVSSSPSNNDVFNC